MTKERELLMIAAHKRGTQDYFDGKLMLPPGSGLEESLCYMAGYYGSHQRDVNKALRLKEKADELAQHTARDSN